MLGAAQSGADLRDLAGLAAEIYARSLPDDPDKKQEQAFEDRSVKLETTFDGAGVLTGELSPECASIVGTVLDALSAPAGAEDNRSQGQRYHDALHEALQRLITAGLLPERAGQPVKAWVHMSLADLMVLEGSSALLEEWTSRVRAQWAGHRAEASAGGGDGGAWLDGDAAAAMACDAAMAPVVTGDVNPAALEDLVRLCVQLDRLRHHPRTGPDDTSPGDSATGTGTGGGTGRTARTAPAPGRARPARTPPGRGRRWSARSSARPWTSCRARAGWRRSCAAGSSAPGLPPEPAAGHRLLRDHPGLHPQRGHPAGSALPVGRAVQPARQRRARCTTSSTRRTAARPALDDCVLLCLFHHQVVIHRWGWTLVLNPDGTTTAWNPDKTKVLHSHGRPPRPGNARPPPARKRSIWVMVPALVQVEVAGQAGPAAAT